MTTGVIVIGRNEGERLRRCLASMVEQAEVVVYVDSGSADESVSIARSFGHRVLSLDPKYPFSAARARNEGFALLTREHPEIRFVQFVDGDCMVAAGWLAAAVAALDERAERAAVLGHVSEANPDNTVFNRLCALEWKSGTGDIENFGALGGIFMVRVEVFRQLGGFNREVIAGEDSELGVRMSLAGFRVTKIDQPMVCHDANMTRFAQWWKRAVRAGHAIGQRAFLNGDTPARDCVRERKSTWCWGIGLPLAVLLFLIPSHGASLLLLLAAYGVLGWRVYRFRRQMGDSPADALLYARYLLLAKIANGLGLLKFYWNRLFKQYRIIEYK
jgi:GT2 family glycosyltransferase